jgi:outer membrane receptor protein involved in Fe transport
LSPVRKLVFAVRAAASLLLPAASQQLCAAETIEEIQVIGITPGAFAGQLLNKVPHAVFSATADDLATSQALDLSDFLNNRQSSVNINSAQNNPLQPDVQFRGFTASPLLGLPQGLSVYQNGVRINEPLGDAVNWDLLPESAVQRMELVSGSNPVFGLNTLGGALSLTMKNGFTFEGQQAEILGGSWGRITGSVESGGNDGQWGYYVNLSHFQEDGWRQLSESDASNFFGTLSWRAGERAGLDLSYQQGDSELIGNGALPVGLLNLQRAAVFTAPDITANDMKMLDLSARFSVSGTLELSGNAFWRDNRTTSFNGDGSEFEICAFAGGALALFEEADDIEDALEDELDIELDGICEGSDASIRSYADLEELIEQRAAEAGLDPDAFEPENVFDELSGTGVLADAAINNLSRRDQQSRGLQGQVQITEELFARPNQFVAGYSWFRGVSDFAAVLELANLDPVTRSTRGLGTGTFLDSAATDIATRSETWSLYFSDTLDLSPALALTFAGRFNETDITLRDRSGVRPELNGDHRFARFNPALGLAWNPSATMTVYGSLSEANRVPTPIELACNEGVFELARVFAEAVGDDPGDIDFECRLPNAFLADPPLDDVVTTTAELGMRGKVAGMDYQLGLFRARNRDDILFQTTGRSTGLFANVDETRRQGVEANLSGTTRQLDWYAALTYVRATFEDDFMVLSPNHPNADVAGELQVEKGDRLPGLPEGIVKLGGDYHVTTNLSVGVEAVYNSSQVIRGDEANELDEIAGFTLVNLRASYMLGGNFSLFARVTNLFGENYENFGLLGEDPGEVLPALVDKRPLFLGAGAPRAAWVGMKLRF